MKNKLKEKIDIGNTLRKYRDLHSFSQQNVSDFLDISRQAYRKWENNDVDFSISQLEKIASLYKVPLYIIINKSYVQKEDK